MKKTYIFIMLFILISAGISYASAMNELDSISNASSTLFLEISTDKSQNTALEGDEIVYNVASNKDCNIIFLRCTPKDELFVLLPNKSHPGFYISGNTKYQIPGYNMKHIVLYNPGTERIKAIATTKEDLLEKCFELRSDEDIMKVNSPEAVLKKLKTLLKTFSKDEWATSEITISVQPQYATPLASNTPYVDPTVTNIINQNEKDKEATACYIQGIAYYEQKKYDNAIKQFKEVIRLSPGLGYGYYALGLAYQAKGAFKEAISYYKKCMNYGVKERDCYVRIGEIYDQLKDKKEAYIRYKIALKKTEGYEGISLINPPYTGKERIYELEMQCLNELSDKKSRMELAVIYEKRENYKAGCYHLKTLLKQAIPLYGPCSYADDKPEIEKPLPPPDPVFSVEIDIYTYYAPYSEPYIPPPPPPVIDSPLIKF